MDYEPDFLLVPYRLVVDKKVTESDLKVYMVVHWFEKMAGKKCIASNAAIGRFSGVHQSTVANSLSNLEKLGYVTRTFKDEEKKHRERVMCNLRVLAKLDSPVGETGTKLDSPVGEQISNNNIFTNVNILSSPKKPRQRKSLKYDNKDPYFLTEFVEKMKSSPLRKFQILSEYAKAKNHNFTTKGQWYAFIDRNIRTAKELEPYTDKQLAHAYMQIEKNLRTDKNPDGYITRWTLETLRKYLD
jgi:hypothetical protein